MTDPNISFLFIRKLCYGTALIRCVSFQGSTGFAGPLGLAGEKGKRVSSEKFRVLFLKGHYIQTHFWLAADNSSFIRASIQREIVMDGLFNFISVLI